MKHNLPTHETVVDYFEKTGRRYVICIDFDHTLCDSGYPKCGDEIVSICNYIRYMKRSLYVELILWTCRTGDSLIEAIQWCKDHHIHLDEVNRQGYFDETQFTESRKIFCNTLIDDCAYGFDINDFKEWED